MLKGPGRNTEIMLVDVYLSSFMQNSSLVSIYKNVYICCLVFGRTRMERENQDLALEQIKLKAAEQRATVLESIK